MSKILVLHGFFINCDQYNRMKIMFLDDYELDVSKKLSFTKQYITKKSNTNNGKSPITDNDTSLSYSSWMSRLQAW